MEPQSVNKDDKDNTLIAKIIIVVILIFVLLISIYYIRYTTNTSSKANGPKVGNSISVANSYIFASPVRAKAGTESIRITVFLLDDEGNGVYDKHVSLNDPTGLSEIKEIQSLSDETGKAMFDINSITKGTYFIESYADGILLPQKVKVLFD